MQMAEIRARPESKRLDELAQRLSKPEAHDMYESMEHVLRMVIGDMALNSALVMGEGRDMALATVKECGLLADYFAEQKARYI